MPKLLSSGVLRYGGSGQFISLPGAQPALGPSPTTGTGFTLVTDITGITSYASSLGYLQFSSGTIYSYVPGQNITIATTGTGTFQVNAPTVFNNDVLFNNTLTFVNLLATGLVRFPNTATSTGTTTGALVVGGGTGIGGDLYVGGTIYGKISTSSLTSLTLDTTRVKIESTATTGTFYLLLGSTLTNTTPIEATSTLFYSVSSQTFYITPNLNVGQNATVQQNLTVNNQLNAFKVFDSGSRVISRVVVGPGIGINGQTTGSSTGPTVVLTNTGVLSLTAGTGTNVNSTTGNVTVWITPPTLQYVTQQGNSTTNVVYLNNTSTAISTTTASLVVAGGVAIGKNLIVGTTVAATTATFDTLRVTSTADYTSITTVTQNSIYTAGGVGIGGDLTVIHDTIIYGNLTVLGTQTIVTTQTVDVGRKVIALSTSAGPAILAIDSGITVGPISSPFAKFLYDGVNAWKSTGNVLPAANTTYNLGSAGYQWNNLYAATSNVYSQSNVYALTSSTAPTNGALVVYGGIGVVGNSTYGGTQIINNLTSATNTSTGALQVAGGVGVQGDLYARNVYNGAGSPYITEAALSAYGVSRVYAGTDTAVSTYSGVVTVWNTSTLQSITNRGADTNRIISFSNTTDSTGTTTGAVVITGGLGIGKNLYVGGNAIIYGTVTFTGSATNVLTTNTVFTDNIIELHKPSTGTEWQVDDGKDIGIRFHYYDNTGTNAFLGRANDTGALEWYSVGIENTGSTFTGTYGTFKTGSITLTNTTASTNPTSGALTVAGGAGIGGDAWIGGTIYANSSTVVTAATLGIYGVASLTAGTDTAVSTSIGAVTVWNISTLNSITSRGNVTNNPIIINNLTPTIGTGSGALVVAGGVGIQGSLNVANTITTTYFNAQFANIQTLQITSLGLVGDFSTTSPNVHPVSILSNVASTSTFLAYNSNAGGYSGYTALNNEGNYIELGISGSANNYSYYGKGTGFLYINPSLSSFNIGDNTAINFFTQGNANTATLRLDTTGLVTINSGLLVQNTSTIGHSTIILKNTGYAGQSWTLDVGGSNAQGQNGTGVNEGNFTLYDNITSNYRLVVTTGTGHVLINSSVDDGINQLQVTGSARITDKFFASTSSLYSLAVTSTSTFGGAITANSSVSIAGTSTFASTATFNQTVVVGSSALETSVTNINTIDPTSIDSFNASLYRSCRSVVQVTDLTNGYFQLVEIILLHDDYSQVYKSEYGIIETGGALGEFTTSLVSGRVVLYYTAYNTSVKRINVVRTSIGV
jgi:hypothetical protein